MEEKKKPKDISDLKARLGIAPKPAPTGAPPFRPGGVAPPPGMAPPGMAPPGMPGRGVAPPPFGQPQPTPREVRDPFAAPAAGYAPAAAPQEVRIVVDESAVSNREVGRGRGLFFVGAFVVLVAGLGVGYCSGNTMADRRIYNSSVNDAREIRDKITHCAKVLEGLQGRVTDAVQLAGTKRQADIELVNYMRPMLSKKPLAPSDLGRRNYLRFQPQTIDQLFDYFNQINVLWDRMGSHVVRTLNDSKALDAARTTAETLLKTKYGVVFVSGQQGVDARLVILSTPYMQNNNQVGWNVQEDLGRPAAQRLFWIDGPLNPRTHMIPLEQGGGFGLLGQNLSAFQEYVGRLSQIRDLINRSVESQRPILQTLQEIASLNTVFVL